MAVDVNTALCTVDDVAAALSIPIPVVNPTPIEVAIELASAEIAAYLGRDLGYLAASTRRQRGAPNTRRIQLRRFPIYSVASLSTDGGTTTTPWADVGGNIDDEGRTGLLYLGCGFFGAGMCCDRNIDNVVTVSEGGYRLPGQTGVPSYVVDLPAAIRQSCISAACAIFRSMNGDPTMTSGAVASESLLSHSVTYASGTQETGGYAVGYTAIGFAIPVALQHALARYRLLVHV